MGPPRSRRAVLRHLARLTACGASLMASLDDPLDALELARGLAGAGFDLDEAEAPSTPRRHQLRPAKSARLDLDAADHLGGLADLVPAGAAHKFNRRLQRCDAPRAAPTAPTAQLAAAAPAATVPQVCLPPHTHARARYPGPPPCVQLRVRPTSKPQAPPDPRPALPPPRRSPAGCRYHRRAAHGSQPPRPLPRRALFGGGPPHGAGLHA